MLGAEGNTHLLRPNFGEEKKLMMGSLLGLESSRPCSHNTKLWLRAAMIRGFSWSGGGGGYA